MPGHYLDCAGLVICTARELGIVPKNFDVPPYHRVPDGVTMMALCDKYMTPVSEGMMRYGDVVVLIVDKEPQHLGILAKYKYGGLSIIHAVETAEKVIETRYVESRAMKFRAAYSFPGIV